MSKADKQDGIPTIQEQRKFPKEHGPHSKYKGKKRFGFRQIHRVEGFVSNGYWTPRWHYRVSYTFYKTEAGRDAALRTRRKDGQYYHRYYIFEVYDR